MNITDCVFQFDMLSMYLDVSEIELGDAEAFVVLIKAVASNGNAENDSWTVWANGPDVSTKRLRYLCFGELGLSDDDYVELTATVHMCKRVATAEAAMTNLKSRKVTTVTAPLIDSQGTPIAQVSFSANAAAWERDEAVLYLSSDLDEPGLDGPWRFEALRVDQGGISYINMSERLEHGPGGASFEITRKGIETSKIDLQLVQFAVDAAPIASLSVKPAIRFLDDHEDRDQEGYDVPVDDEGIDGESGEVDFDSDVTDLVLPEGVQYLIALNGRKVHSAICYKVVAGDLFGAFYGYTGGGTYDDGKFRIVKGQAETETGAASEEFASNSDEETHYIHAIQSIWQLIRQPVDGEGEAYLTTAAQRLVKAGTDRISSIGFDGDLLSDVSAEWPLFLNF